MLFCLVAKRLGRRGEIEAEDAKPDSLDDCVFQGGASDCMQSQFIK